MRLTTMYCAMRCLGFAAAPLMMSLPAGAVTPLAVSPAFVHSFTEKPDGAQPLGGLVKGSDGSLYGTTQYGGIYGYDPLDNANGNGTIFRIAADGTYSVLYSFQPMTTSLGNPDGRWPSMALTAATDGSLYGTTPYGGSSDGGVVFHYLTSTGTTSGLSVLRNFVGNDADPNGSQPEAGVAIGLDGLIYGTTQYGGTVSPDDGTVFKVGSDGSNFKVLKSFGNATKATLPDGQLLAASDGKLYGVTQYYSGSPGGALYRIAPSGSGFVILHKFNLSTEGEFYYVGTVPGVIEGSDGYLYGATMNGGGGEGAVYRVAKNGTGFKILHHFAVLGSGGKNTGGGRVHTPVIFGSDGLLYGATQLGGANGNGTVYRMAKDGTGFTTLYEFPALSGGTNATGALPTGSVAFNSQGQLCGTAYEGGTAGLGTAWCLKLN